MNETQEIHLETLKELSKTNKLLSKQLEKTTKYAKDQNLLILEYQNICRQMFQSLKDKKTEDVLEISWYQALKNVLNKELSLTFDKSCQKGHLANEVH